MSDQGKTNFERMAELGSTSRPEDLAEAFCIGADYVVQGVLAGVDLFGFEAVIKDGDLLAKVVQDFRPSSG